MKSAFGIYSDPRILAILCLGFTSGLPLALTASTLGVWLTEAGISKTSIGLFAAVATPYALKFLWSPLIDGTSFPLLGKLLGRRTGWLVATQIALIAAIMLLGFANPAIDPWFTALAALLVTICSASQDIVIDAYRVEILPKEEQGAGAAAVVLGYRLGMILSTAGALYLASHVSWLTTYWIMALFIVIGIAAVLLCGEPHPAETGRMTDDEAMSVIRHPSTISWLQANVVAPFADFMQRDHWLAILLFILLYKLADAFMGVMTNPFLIETGFTKEQIATVVKLYGVLATIIGSIIGGWMVARFGMMKSLWVCGIGHGLTNLMFVLQAHVGADMHLLAASIALENVTGGMGTAAFVAYISSLTHVRFTATQYALLSSFASFGRTWLSTPAGWFAEQLGWIWFFSFASALAIPGLLALGWLSRHMTTEDIKNH